MTSKYIAVLAASSVLLTLVVLAACSPQLPPSPPTPQLEAIVSPSPSPSPTTPPTWTPTALLAPPTQTPTPVPPTETLPPSPTPGPVEYVIQPGDTLLFIIQQPPFNYRDFGVIQTILRLNPTIPNADRLPPPGSVILIPLPTTAPTPIVDSLTATVQAGIPQIELPVSTTIIQHAVREGETILGIAEQYRTTLRILRDLNPSIGFFNCDFANPSGGPDCTVILGPDAVVNVPAPTPTPTLSPTPSGLETATPTPTFEAPLVSFPPRDAVITAAAPFNLLWVSVGVLEAQQVYLVQIENLTNGAVLNDITRSTSFRIPDLMLPTGGEPNAYRWRVSVAAQNADGLYAVTGAEGQWRNFAWAAG